jgi:thiosulfate/3-mercaptopyruvate sulfurtransferase
MASMRSKNPGPLVDTAWLADHIQDANLRIIDARWREDGSSRQAYAAGHIPGAVPLDWRIDLGETRQGVRDLLLSPERFAGVMGRSGIGNETFVVAYAEKDYSGAARLWWALRHYGHEKVAVLDGGMTRWMAEGRPLSTETPDPAPAVFIPREVPKWRVAGWEILAHMRNQRGEFYLVDNRPPEQYQGRAVWTTKGSFYLPSGEEWVEAEGKPLRGGHIPGAVNLPSTQFLHPVDWTFRSREELRQLLLARQVYPEGRVITYCGVGISASLGLFALYLAGYRDLALYDASWDEWGADSRFPVESGEPGEEPGTGAR